MDHSEWERWVRDGSDNPKAHQKSHGLPRDPDAFATGNNRHFCLCAIFSLVAIAFRHRQWAHVMIERDVDSHFILFTASSTPTTFGFSSLLEQYWSYI